MSGDIRYQQPELSRRDLSYLGPLHAPALIKAALSAAHKQLGVDWERQRTADATVTTVTFHQRVSWSQRRLKLFLSQTMMEPTMQKLPAEILCEIFSSFVGSPRSNQAPREAVLLSSVCAKWRTVVTGMPLLWKHINVPYHSPELVGLILERSKPCPLDIIIFYKAEIDDFDRLLSLIAEHCERWQTVTLHIPAAQYGCLVSIRGRLPLLQRLIYFRRYTHPASFSGFELAPALQDLRLGHFDRELLTNLPTPCSQLTRLYLEFDDPSVILSILARTPNLVHLALNKMGDGAEGDHELCFPVILPHLSLLELTMDEYSDPSDVLHFITAPILLDLDLHAVVGSVECTAELIARSACSLESLKLFVDDCDQALISLLGQMPRIVHLEIRIDDPGLTSIDGESPFAELFPNLEEMNLAWEEDSDEDGCPQLIARAF